MYFKNGNFLFILSIVGCIYGCAPLSPASKSSRPQKSNFSLKLLDVYTIPYNHKFSETVVGGLSGIDYDRPSGKYYIISDERSATSPSRFYTADIKISNNKIADVVFLSVHQLTNAKGAAFPPLKEDPANAADPESIRYNPVQKSLIWTDEGDKSTRGGVPVLRNPFVYTMNMQGQYIDSFSLPQNLYMQAGENGPRNNGVFEGSTFDSNYKNLYVSAEEPLLEDGRGADVDHPNAPIRVTRFDVNTKKAVAQYAYLLDAVARIPFPRDAFRVNGVSDILWFGDEKLLVMERSFSTGSIKCDVKIYLADLKNATNVMNVASLKDSTGFRAASKKILLDMNDISGHVDNVEGMTFGPRLPNGNQSLILIADNNFQMLQKQQVFLFEVQK